MNRTRIASAAAVVLLTAAGAAGCQSATTVGASPAPSPTAAAPSATGDQNYSYYRTMMGRFGSGSMMGGGGPSGWMGRSGYRWMAGGGSASAPAWMRGSALPGFMMGGGMMGGGGSDPGRAMGRFWADAPGPRLTPDQAARLGDQPPSGATVDRASRRITFTGRTVHLVVLASPSMPAENFRIAGLTNPTVVVPAGADVSLQLVNADEDMAHGLVVTTAGTASSWMPMMNSAPAFTGAALWFLGDATSAGMHTGTLTFTAATPGTYRYLCPVPGHAQKGMAGTFQVTRGG